MSPAPGDRLPPLSIPISRTLIIATAFASRDFQDVHHDPALAVERGSKDVFMNILTTNGLIERYLRGWAGPEAVVKRISIRLGAPCYPGDTLVFSGTVDAVTGDSVEVSVKGENGLGTHAGGTAVVVMRGASA